MSHYENHIYRIRTPDNVVVWGARGPGDLGFAPTGAERRPNPRCLIRIKSRSLERLFSLYIFFSLSGYTEWLENLKDEDVLLLTLGSLYE